MPATAQRFAMRSLAPPRLGRLLLLAILTTLVAGAAPTPKPIRFAQVQPGDTLVVHYSAVGCFYSEAAKFVFSPRQHGQFVVTESVRSVDVPGAHDPLGRGTIYLEAGEVAKLDRLLDRYRQPRDPKLITLIGPAIPVLHLQLRRGGRIVAEENLHPQAPFDDDDVLTFGTLLRALREDARR